MRRSRLEDMTNGWLVGAFEPSVHETNTFEVAVKYYSAGDRESLHHHKIATEITVIVSGEVEMNGIRYCSGDILTIEPNESSDFWAVTDVATTVIKVPSALNDKYIDEGE
jgi:mannose-6-phosphate isomerase-like protein (cupin superfamily)